MPKKKTPRRKSLSTTQTQPSGTPSVEATNPTRRISHRFSKLIVIGMFIILSIVSFQCYVPPSYTHQPTSVSIPSGASVITMAGILSTHGVIRSPLAFRLYTTLLQLDKTLHAGTYQLSPSYSLVRTIRILQEKEGPASLISLTIPEGYALSQIAILCESHHIASANTVHAYLTNTAISKFRDQYNFLADIPTNSMEGYLFPDTYVLAEGNDISVLIDQCLNRFSSKILPIWNSRPSSYPFTLHQTLTLASIIQKEAYITSEMPIISSVYHNRLKKHMRLAACPTVLYAIGKPHKHVLHYRDLTVNSPYNTYIHIGLPPTPIAAPGIKAFQAALFPHNTDYYYFLSKGNGRHLFSKTHADHIRGKKKYLEK